LKKNAKINSFFNLFFYGFVASQHSVQGHSSSFTRQHSFNNYQQMQSSHKLKLHSW